MPENAAFYPALTGQGQVRHYLTLRGENPSLATVRLEKVGLAQAARRRIGTYSKGMRKHVDLAPALIGHLRLLVLDEPASGLDSVSQCEFYTLLAAQRASILLSSHALTEDETRTDRITLRNRGIAIALILMAVFSLAGTGYRPDRLSVTVASLTSLSVYPSALLGHGMAAGVAIWADAGLPALWRLVHNRSLPRCPLCQRGRCLSALQSLHL